MNLLQIIVGCDCWSTRRQKRLWLWKLWTWQKPRIVSKMWRRRSAYARCSHTPTLYVSLGTGVRGRHSISFWSTVAEESSLTESVRFGHFFVVVGSVSLSCCNVHLVGSECMWRAIVFYSICHLTLILTEPDVGMPEKDAHRFFQQLIAGVVSFGWF